MQPPLTAIDPDRTHSDNLRLSQLEYDQRHVYLYSRPRCLGLVLGTACNIDCIHCYQARNGGSLLRPSRIAAELRRELIDDVAALVARPILSISTNGTLIDDAWAERLVRTPFSNVTVSIDGGTRATYNRLRRGADLDHVLANIDRVQRWKAQLRSDRPCLDSFFVIMRSNFREIPEYLELMHRHGMIEVALQTMELSSQNLARVPTLEADESITDRREVEELHAMLREVLPRFQRVFRTIRVSGLQTLFESHGLSSAFLEEGEKSLYPDSEGLSEGTFELCPNPWTTLFLVENGDAHLCFISQPIGNLYAEPLSSLWNSPKAIAKRSDMIAGRYLASGCSSRHCGWREGKASPPRPIDSAPEWRELVQIQRSEPPELETPETLALVRRLVADERRKRGELEASGQQHIDHLEAKADKAVADFRSIEAAFREYRRPWLVRAAHKACRVFGALR